jgi:UDP-N-acetylglucosamine--N-acetylmuramyl-(pentapeptide) pyrophosphoryl-undecaprenol N-acetylglucosamine transferase
VRLIVAGGGTGGHLFPGIAVAEEFLARGNGNEVLFVGSERGIEARILPKLGFRHEFISASGIRGKGLLSRAKGLAMLLHSYSQARRILRSFRPDRVLGVGGYASGPVMMAARGLGLRCFIHEQNAIPGFTNKALGRFSDRVFISIEESGRYFPKGKIFLTGNPIRKEILAEIFNNGRQPDGNGDFRILVFGGSAGAHSINMNMIAALPYLGNVKDRLSITHQTGENDLEEVRGAYKREGFRFEALPFIDDMAAAYRNADLVVCRAGATTVAEVTACGKACIFIPYPFAVDDHQRRNAEALLKRGAGFMILDRELTGESLGGLVGELVRNPEMITAAGRSAKSLARLDAAQVIVDEIIKSG